MAVGLVGYIILMVSRTPALSYFAVFLAASGIYPLIPNTIAWVSNNVSNRTQLLSTDFISPFLWGNEAERLHRRRVASFLLSIADRRINLFFLYFQTEGAYKRSLTLGMLILLSSSLSRPKTLTRDRFSSGMVIGFGNLNGAVSSNIYRAKDKPRYVMGHGLVLAYIALGFIGSLTYMILLKRENARRDRGEVSLPSLPLLSSFSSTSLTPSHLPPLQRNEIIDPSVDAEFVTNEKVFNSSGQRVFRSDEHARKELGDQHSSFRYVI